MSQVSVRFLHALALIALAAVLPGCESDELQSSTANKLRAVGNFYLEYAVEKKGAGPEDEKQLKKHLSATSDQVLSAYGLTRASLDGLLTSDRDGEPFIVVYGVVIKGVSGTSAPVVAHEKTGKNGKKLVGFANGKVELVSDEKLNELLAAKW